ncbi:hypothetical protein ACWGIB_21700 [Streptomyces xiamenensis]
MAGPSLARQWAHLGPLHENSPGEVGRAASPVLATPSAFAAGMGIVVGAYVVGRMIGSDTEPVIQ